MATGSGRDTWRYHPLLAEMLRSELATHRPGEARELNRLAAGILEALGDVAGAVRCLLAGGDTDRAFSIVFGAAHRRADLADVPGIAAFVNLFPRELVTGSASRMLTYALMLGLSGQLAEAHAWLQRARARIGDEPEPGRRTSRPSTRSGSSRSRSLAGRVTRSTPAAGRSTRLRRAWTSASAAPARG